MHENYAMTMYCRVFAQGGEISGGGGGGATRSCGSADVPIVCTAHASWQERLEKPFFSVVVWSCTLQRCGIVVLGILFMRSPRGGGHALEGGEPPPPLRGRPAYAQALST